MPFSWSHLPVLDPDAWGEFIELWRDDDPGAAQVIVNEFLDLARSHRETMRSAIMNGDGKSLEFCAHSLKSSSGNLGALRMQDICHILQDQGRDGSVAAAAESMRHFEEILEATAKAFASEFPAAN